ncbi:MAG: sigma-70 family RNA polymerase sigma factor [Myxococcales bacterium]
MHAHLFAAVTIAPETTTDVSSRDELIRSHLPLVRSIAAQLIRSAPPPLTFDDLVAYGRVGLVTAATRFDSSRGPSFADYAAPRIRGAMWDGFRKEGPFGDCRERKRLPKLERVRVEDDEQLGRLMLGDQHGCPQDDWAERADYRKLVTQLSDAVGKLPAHLRDFTVAHYYKDVPLHDLGRQLGVSKYAVQRLRNTALREISSLLVTRHRELPVPVGRLQ